MFWGEFEIFHYLDKRTTYVRKILELNEDTVNTDLKKAENTSHLLFTSTK